MAAHRGVGMWRGRVRRRRHPCGRRGCSGAEVGGVVVLPGWPVATASRHRGRDTARGPRGGGENQLVGPGDDGPPRQRRASADLSGRTHPPPATHTSRSLRSASGCLSVERRRAGQIDTQTLRVGAGLGTPRDSIPSWRPVYSTNCHLLHTVHGGRAATALCQAGRALCKYLLVRATPTPERGKTSSEFDPHSTTQSRFKPDARGGPRRSCCSQCFSLPIY